MITALTDISTPFLLAQLFAILGTATSLIAPQFKSERTLLIINLPGGLFWAIHFALMGGITGAVIACINVSRNAICVFLPKEYHKPAIVFALCCVLLSGCFTWGGWHSLLPIFASCMTGMALLFQQKGKTLRLLMATSTSAWMVYEFSIGAYFAAAISACIVASKMIGLARKYLFTQPQLIPAE